MATALPGENDLTIPKPKSPLLERDVLLYLVARFLWVLSNQMSTVAVGWLVYDVTNSAMALGLVGLAAFAPKLFLVFVSGIVADRFQRNLILAGCLAINGAVSVGLLFTVISPPVQMSIVYTLLIILGVAKSFAVPAAQALVASLVPRQHFSRVVGLASSVTKFAAITGPALGGLLYLGGSWVPFACTATGFLVAAVMNFMIRRQPLERSKEPVRLSDAFAGLVFVWQQKPILGAISLDLFSVLFGGATALMPIIARDVLHVGPLGLGVLQSAPAVGAMVVGLTLAYVPIQRHAGRKLFIATAIFGLATIGLGLSSYVYLTLLFLLLIGASDVVSVVIRHTLVQGDTPDAMRGRVSAVNSLFIGASNELGEFESGATAALFGLVPAIVLGGAGTIAVAGLWAFLFPQLRQRDYLVEPGENGA
ncbi:MFS transporter [Aliiruegeria lutimaris]|uniref:Predicted arabinose efflux permease, MFS family n=1 Tax=Aliiruegeria lutimaris TaxID=571298 RepID=A0A1G9AEV4_9RHOB|nr:MFS transporter [Aliiruegeria lutimaris]SDK25788.1 Predicted arabinose efflux permease, MFS family [Aliiruegeria lutimaris]